MAKPETFVCPDCGTAFGSKWARTDHEKQCPVKQSTELRRVQEQLEWKRARIERWTSKKYRAGKTLVSAIEVLCAVYFGIALFMAAHSGHYLSLPFILLFFLGYAYVGVLSLYQAR